MAMFAEQPGRQGDPRRRRGAILEALRGETDPEKKRKIIGGLFVEIFDEEAQQARRTSSGWRRARSTRT